MAIFSNLEGTMKKDFVLGKNGVKLSTDGTDVKIYNYEGTLLLPVEAGEPTKDQHLVTLNHLNTKLNSTILRGTDIPDSSTGEDGNVYYQIDTTNIVNIFIKDSGIWKPLISIPSV